MTITIETAHLILAVVGIVFGLAVNAWGVIRFLISRLDAQRQDIAKQIESLRGGVVMRADYEREIQRLHSEVSGVREAVNLNGNNQTARIDALIIALRDKA